MALVVIGLAGMTLTRLVSRSLALTLEARAGELALQRRWAVLSLQSQLMRDPERLFGDLAASFEEQSQGWPHPSQIRGGCQIGPVRCQLVLADEQAKVSLNALQEQRPGEIPGMLADAAFASPRGVPILLRPTPQGASNRRRAYQSWGQVVDLAALATQEGRAGDLLAVADGLTCWGDGRLNATRASDDAFEAVARFALTGPDVQKLLDARRGFDGELDDLLSVAALPRRKAFAVKRLLTDRSRCHALWLVASDAKQSRLHVAVADTTSRDKPAIQTLTWP